MTPVWLVATAAGGGVVAGPLLERVARHSPRRDPGTAPTAVQGRLDNWGRRPALAFALVAGGLEAAVAARLGEDWACAAMIVFVAGLLTLSWSDVVQLLLLKRILYPAVVVTVALLLAASGANGQWHRFGTAAACGAVSFACFLALNLVNSQGLAFGDVRLAGAMGLVLGWLSVRCALEGFVVGTVVGALTALGLLAGRRVGRGAHLPYGLFLSTGAIVAILVSGPAALR